MGSLELFVLAVGLSMDAFAVSICKGLAMKKISVKNMIIVGLWFGFFQMTMPLIGYFLGIGFQDKITAIDHWIAFILLGIIGGNMILEACSKEEDEEEEDASLAVKTMLLLSIATSIDALAVGITFAFLQDTNIALAVVFIGAITCIISAVGVRIGHVFGCRFKRKAEFMGGMILILLGVKILLEHLGFLSF